MVKVCRRPKGSGPRLATGLIPSERAPKTMGTAIEFVLFHGFHGEISWIKGGPGNLGGGWGPVQSGAPWGSGGECFAPITRMHSDTPGMHSNGIM